MAYRRIRKRPYHTLKENIPMAILYGTATTIAILVVLYYLSKGKVDIVTSIIALVSGAFIALFTYHYQSISEIKREKVLNEINQIASDQQRILLSTVRGPLIRIGVKIRDLDDKISPYLKEIEQIEQEPNSRGPSIPGQSRLEPEKQIESLKKFKEHEQKYFDETVDNIQQEAKNIHNFIGEIYGEILVTTSYFREAACIIIDLENKEETIKKWKEACRKAKHESEILIDDIDYFLFGELKPEHFKEVKFSTVLQESSRCTIVVGSKRERTELNRPGPWSIAPDDKSAANQLKTELDEKIKKISKTARPPPIKIVHDKEIDEQLRGNHLILIGGPRINRFTREMSRYFPLQYIQIENKTYDNPTSSSDTMYSRISGQVYSGSNYAIVEGIRNPLADDNKFIIVAFGSDNEGTKTAIRFLIDMIKDDIVPDNKLKNSINDSYPARVLEKQDSSTRYKDIE